MIASGRSSSGTDTGCHTSTPTCGWGAGAASSPTRGPRSPVTESRMVSSPTRTISLRSSTTSSPETVSPEPAPKVKKESPLARFNPISKPLTTPGETAWPRRPKRRTRNWCSPSSASPVRWRPGKWLSRASRPASGTNGRGVGTTKASFSPWSGSGMAVSFMAWASFSELSSGRCGLPGGSRSDASRWASCRSGGW